jgi:hypothetical protein
MGSPWVVALLFVTGPLWLVLTARDIRRAVQGRS